MMQDSDVSRSEWPMGIVAEAIKSDDGKVRKAKIEVIKEGKKKTFLRPISELIRLFSCCLRTVKFCAFRTSETYCQG